MTIQNALRAFIRAWSYKGTLPLDAILLTESFYPMITFSILQTRRRTRRACNMPSEPNDFRSPAVHNPMFANRFKLNRPESLVITI